MSAETLILDRSAIQRTMTRIGHEIAERNPDGQDLVLVGIQTGGVHLAERLSLILSAIYEFPIPVGHLDVNMHRDDLNSRLTPQIHPTVMPFDITGKCVVLVDDVLFRGRTTRAALDALNDFGRPNCVQLAVLIDRGHRELPIKADFVGKNVPTSLRERINVQLIEEGSEERVVLEKSLP